MGAGIKGGNVWKSYDEIDEERDSDEENVIGGNRQENHPNIFQLHPGVNLNQNDNNDVENGVNTDNFPQFSESGSF